MESYTVVLDYASSYSSGISQQTFWVGRKKRKCEFLQNVSVLLVDLLDDWHVLCQLTVGFFELYTVAILLIQPLVNFFVSSAIAVALGSPLLCLQRRSTDCMCNRSIISVLITKRKSISASRMTLLVCTLIETLNFNNLLELSFLLDQ